MEIFNKKLTKTDVGTRFSMKTGSLISFPRFERGQLAQVVILEDIESGESWRFHLIIRGGKYKKPVLSGNWLRFVKEKRLEIGDEVQFSKEEDEASGVKYRIGIKKAVKLFNVVIG